MKSNRTLVFKWSLSIFPHKNECFLIYPTLSFKEGCGTQAGRSPSLVSYLHVFSQNSKVIDTQGKWNWITGACQIYELTYLSHSTSIQMFPWLQCGIWLLTNDFFCEQSFVLHSCPNIHIICTKMCFVVPSAAGYFTTDELHISFSDFPKLSRQYDLRFRQKIQLNGFFDAHLRGMFSCVHEC